MFFDKKNIAHSESKKSFFIKNAWHCTDTAAQILDIAIVCPTVEDGPKWKLAFWYPVSQFSTDFHEIL